MCEFHFTHETYLLTSGLRHPKLEQFRTKYSSEVPLSELSKVAVKNATALCLRNTVVISYAARESEKGRVDNIKLKTDTATFDVIIPPRVKSFSLASFLVFNKSPEGSSKV